LRRRGEPLLLHSVALDRRYLISEMACRSLETSPEGGIELVDALICALREHRASGAVGSVTIGRLLAGDCIVERYAGRAVQLEYAANEMLGEAVESESDVLKRCDALIEQFAEARRLATENTKLYLSMIDDFDVYVATSMRRKADFEEMSAFCERVFGDERLSNLNLRHFDATVAAAAGSEDKGLLECLILKSAKVLIYCAGGSESYGKDAEAAMALSLGKPVIFYCDHQQRQRFYNEVHPLSRVIDFQTGVAVGAMVASSPDEVAELLLRVFTNRMEYELEQRPAGFLRLREKLTGSVVRLQTSDRLLRETLWNYYQRGALVRSDKRGSGSKARTSR
jgi:hypothetical protein